MRTAKLKCGCQFEVGERERWVALCPTHEAEFQATHARWAAEHQEVRDANNRK